MKLPGNARRLTIIGSIPLLLVAAGFLIFFLPQYTFHPMCTYRSLSKIDSKISVGGKKYSASVVYQNSLSRSGFSSINSSGCKQTHGTALVFRLQNDSVIIVPPVVCRQARKILSSKGETDLLTACASVYSKNKNIFAINSAKQPKSWRYVTSADDFEFVDMTATSTWKYPKDDIDNIAPNILKSRYEGGRSWSQSPERALSFKRRYNPTKSFKFEVKEGPFQIN